MWLSFELPRGQVSVKPLATLLQSCCPQQSQNHTFPPHFAEEETEAQNEDLTCPGVVHCGQRN